MLHTILMYLIFDSPDTPIKSNDNLISLMSSPFELKDHEGTLVNYKYTVRGKILEGENFGELMAPKVFGEEKFGKSVGSLLKTLAFINIGGENFGKLPTVRQIRQNFPTCGIQYTFSFVLTHTYKNTRIQ